MTRKQNDEMTTDKHDDGAVPFDHPPRWVYAKTPRRELDFETLDFRWISHHSDPETRFSRFFGAIRDFLSRLKRRQPEAQVNQPAENAEYWDRPITYTTDRVTIACPVHSDDCTTGGKSFRDRRRD